MNRCTTGGELVENRGQPAWFCGPQKNSEDVASQALRPGVGTARNLPRHRSRRRLREVPGGKAEVVGRATWRSSKLNDLAPARRARRGETRVGRLGLTLSGSALPIGAGRGETRVQQEPVVRDRGSETSVCAMKEATPETARLRRSSREVTSQSAAGRRQRLTKVRPLYLVNRGASRFVRSCSNFPV
jgi:hypothetical protein